MMMHCTSSGGLNHVLGSGLADMLINEVHEVVIGIQSPACIHVNECYACSARPSTERDSKRLPSIHRTEAVEDFTRSSSSDSDLERGETSAPSFNIDLPFGGNEDAEEIASMSSTSTPLPLFNPPSRDPSEEMFQNENRLLFCEETTIEQIDKYGFCLNQTGQNLSIVSCLGVIRIVCHLEQMNQTTMPGRAISRCMETSMRTVADGISTGQRRSSGVEESPLRRCKTVWQPCQQPQPQRTRWMQCPP